MIPVLDGGRPLILQKKGFTAWGAFTEDSDYFAPSHKEFMIYLRGENLEALLDVLKD